MRVADSGPGCFDVGCWLFLPSAGPDCVLVTMAPEACPVIVLPAMGDSVEEDDAGDDEDHDRYD